MSTATARPSATSTTESDRDRGDLLIGEHLEAVRAAIWRAALLAVVLRLLGFLLAACLVFAVVDQWVWSLTRLGRGVAAVGLLLAIGWWTAKRIVPLLRFRISREYAAYSLEHDSPELRHSLATYVSLRDDRTAPGLRGIVVRSIGARAARYLTSTGMAMPSETGGNFRTAMIVVAIFAAVAMYAVLSPKNTLQSFGRLALPLANIAAPTRVHIGRVTPGDSEALFGRPLEFTAKVSGLVLSESPTILLSGDEVGSVEMQPTDGAGLFAATLAGSRIREHFEYRIIAGDARSELYQVRVRDEPNLIIKSTEYIPHPYTGLRPRTSPSGSIDGVEGTRVTVTAKTNRKIARGRIEFNPRTIDGRTSATAGFAPLDIAEDGLSVSATWHLRSGTRGGGTVPVDSYRMRIWDETETGNSDPIEYTIRVTPDLPPEVRITVPAMWPKDVPLGSQQLIEVRAVDPDFGLKDLHLRLRRGTQVIESPQLFASASGELGNQVGLYRFRPDELGLRAGDVITVEAVASDNRTTIDGRAEEPNVTVSDPIDLRVVAPPARNTTPQDRDGLQPKDDQPAAEPQQPSNDQQTGDENQSSGEGQSGEGTQGEGTQGEGTQGEGTQGEGTQGEGTQGEGTQGEGAQGEGTQGEGTQGEGAQGEGAQGEGAQGEGAQGEGAQGEGTQGEGTQGEGTQGEGTQGEGTQGEGTQGEGTQGEGTQGEGAQGEGAQGEGTQGEGTQGEGAQGEGAQGEGAQGEGAQGEGAQGEGAQGEGAQGEGAQGEGAQGEGTQGEGTQGEGTQGDQHQVGGGQSADGQTSEGQAGKGQPGEGQSGANPAGKGQTGEGQSTGNRSTGGNGPDQGNAQHPAPAVSDGQAIERMQEYLNEKRGASPTGKNQQTRNQGASGTQGEGTQGEGTQGEGTQGEGTQSEGTQGEGTQGEGTQGEGTQGEGTQGEGTQGEGTQGEGTQGEGTQGEGTQGEGTQGEGTQGEGTQGEGTQGEGTQGEGTQGEGTQGEGTQGEGTQGEGTQGEGTQGEGTQGEGTQGEGTQGEGTQGEGTQGEGTQGEGTQGEGTQGEGTQGEGTQGEGTQGEGTQPNAESPSGGSDSGSDAAGAGGGNMPQPSSTPESGAQQEGNSAAAGGQSAGGSSGSAAGGGPAADGRPPAPDPVDPEAARRATDMVLDALKHQKDTPDPELLDRLGWTEERLQRFIERWENARRIGRSGDADAARQYEESLRSLGIRSALPRDVRQLESQGDALENVRDAGARSEPPPQFRNSIEAVLRSLNR